MKIVIKIIIITVSTIIGLPILFCVALYGNSLYCNLNPSHVDLQKDGFVKFFSFVTSEKKVLVEVYAKPWKEKNTGEFVIVRKGVLPFGIKLVSTTMSGLCHWIKPLPEMYSNLTKKTIISSPGTLWFDGKLGFYYNLEIEKKYFSKYWSQPSIQFDFIWNKFSNETAFTVYCKFCESIPTFNAFCRNIFYRDVEPFNEDNKIRCFCFYCLHYNIPPDWTDLTKIDSYNLYTNIPDILPIPTREPK
jgi:hypothetical protein